MLLSLRDREVACSASDRKGSNFKSCVWRTVSSQSCHHPQEVLLVQFSLSVHKCGLKPDSFHFISLLHYKNKNENWCHPKEPLYESQKKYVVQKSASAGNRTRATRVAGENSTTEPPMLTLVFSWASRFKKIRYGQYRVLVICKLRSTSKLRK